MQSCSDVLQEDAVLAECKIVGCLLDGWPQCSWWSEYSAIETQVKGNRTCQCFASVVIWTF